jgi:putative membrane protein
MASAVGVVQKPNVSRSHIVLAAIFWICFVLSAIRPHDYFTWFLEVFPGVLAFAALVATYGKFQFTTLVYAFICLHCIVLFVGGHWTYALVPLGDWMKSLLHTSRNDYDRIGHFMQGFVPALVIRELMTRLGVLQRKRWQFFLVTCVCLAISAAYELFEYAVAVASGSASDAFLGSQGDPWDTQNDMLTALIASILAQVIFGRLQDRAMKRLPSQTA